MTDGALQAYHENFLYFYKDFEHAMELIGKVHRNYDYFSDVASLTGKALKYVTMKFGADGVCKALSEFG